MKQTDLNVAVVGATGAVGSEMIKILGERKFPVGELRLLASERSMGKSHDFMGKKIAVEILTKDSFSGIDIALFSAGASRSREFAHAAVEAGAVVIDNSSAFRMEDDVPLVVPEVNPHAAQKHNGIIANPNCSTIQMVAALHPLNQKAKIRRVVVATYQAVSGAGQNAVEELSSQVRSLLSFKPLEAEVFPHQIAFNCLPHIDVFLENGYTKEEMKMVNETRKIMEEPDLLVSPTTVRVPVFYGHSESLNVEFESPMSPEYARDIFALSPGVAVVDDPSENSYPLATECAGRDEVFVGRIRGDNTLKYGLNMWVVSDNIRKGAALNAVQIAELLLRQ
ncbi:MAG: aspartate-semialdehyde dehydrogenase [Nitrospinota bacterium]